jgi:Xaa-Pro aminopeptidase
MYTLCLKGYLQAANAIFPVGTSGKVIDGYARSPLYAKGLDYRHGTGHGVGVYVHEGGVRISSVSDLPMVAGQIVSIEPGYYITGEAGVRIENVAAVKEHPEYKGFLYFESLIYCGLEPSLILNNELTSQEQLWLNDYEAKCTRHGTSFGSRV